jgi:hypothetical protein
MKLTEKYRSTRRLEDKDIVHEEIWEDASRIVKYNLMEAGGQLHSLCHKETNYLYQLNRRLMEPRAGPGVLEKSRISALAGKRTLNC